MNRRFQCMDCGNTYQLAAITTGITCNDCGGNVRPEPLGESIEQRERERRTPCRSASHATETCGDDTCLWCQ